MENERRKYERKRKAGKQLLILLLGILLCGAGLFLFCNRVTVSASSFGNMYGSWGIFGAKGIPGGLVVIPLIIGVIVWIIFPNIFLGKIITTFGALFIILGIISSAELRLDHMKLYEFLLILIMIFGGAALALRVLFMPNIDDEPKKSKIDEINDKLN